ncbi:hypothetical protein HAX54_043602 [Datura stramonium]|uniref:Uncharacterized protein n=1 Tax=Datura stramonium TaxID=4076 RepID=A0ABS8SNM9_DATST|nr:hypothetical protein [Datura stramonium]
MWEQCGGIAKSSGKVCKCGRLVRYGMALGTKRASARRVSGVAQQTLWQVSLPDQVRVSKALLDEWKMRIKAGHEESKEMTRGKRECLYGQGKCGRHVGGGTAVSRSELDFFSTVGEALRQKPAACVESALVTLVEYYDRNM